MARSAPWMLAGVLAAMLLGCFEAIFRIVCDSKR